MINALAKENPAIYQKKKKNTHPDKVGFIPEMWNLTSFGKGNQYNSQQTEK